MIFFTSDTHFGHHNIIKYCNRPFASLEEMNEEMIENWNKEVKANDIVYHLGDFSFRTNKAEDVGEFRQKLNGKIHLILGNHDDFKSVKYHGKFESVSPYREIKVNGQCIILFHYPIRCWNKCHYDSWHLFGHHHNTLSEVEGKCFDIGVDAWNFKPVSFDEVFENMKTRQQHEDHKVKSDLPYG